MKNKIKITIDSSRINSIGRDLTEISCDTIVGVMVDQTEKTNRVNAVYVGEKMLPPVMTKIINDFIIRIAEASVDDKVERSLVLHAMAEKLEAESSRIIAGMTDQEKQDSLRHAREEMFRSLFKMEGRKSGRTDIFF